MLGVLANRTYRHLFLAQVVSLVGTGLATVALGLLAFDLAGARAGGGVGPARAIKKKDKLRGAPRARAVGERRTPPPQLGGGDPGRGGVGGGRPVV